MLRILKPQKSAMQSLIILQRSKLKNNAGQKWNICLNLKSRKSVQDAEVMIVQDNRFPTLWDTQIHIFASAVLPLFFLR